MSSEQPIDGVSPSRMRVLTGKQKAGILILVLATAAGAVFLSEVIGPKQKVEKPEKTISSGMPFRAVAEPAPIEHPRPMPIAAPSIPRFPTKAQGPTKDEAIDAPIFSTAGTGVEGPSGERLGGEEGEKKDKDDEFSAMLRPSDVGAAAKARRLSHPSLTIAAGTLIPCTLLTAIDSQLAGFVTCVTPAEVRSADGSVSLLDKGTQLFGEIRTGLRQGQDRVFVLWVRARTPENVVISLDSPGTDELGRSGVPGEVDNHWWARFGNALLFSVIEGAPQIGSSALQNQGGGGVNTNFTQLFSPTQSLASTILQQSINIPPTINVHQGAAVSVMVARDLRFDGVYALRTSR